MVKKPIAVVAAFAGLLASGAAFAAPQPNIVHIFTDDLGQQDVACYREGRPSLYETPNMDQLARKGMRFTDAYSPAPTCAPSRAAFMSGQYGPRNGVLHVMGGLLPRPLNQQFRYIAPFYTCRLPVDANTIPRVLKQAGYVTAHIKKMHVGGRGYSYPYPVTYGFDFSWGKNKDYNDPELWDKRMKHKQEYQEGLWLPMRPNRLSDFATAHPDDPFRTDPNDDDRPFDGTVDLAVKWMDKVVPGVQPFFHNYCTSMVHGPLSARDGKRFRHYCEKLGIPVPTKLGSMNKERSGQKNPYYATMVDTTDWIVGKLVKYLEATDDPRNPGHKLVDNTYIILSTDNGGCTGIPTKTESGGNEYEQVTDNAPLRGGKQTPYEGGVRIPLIVRGPGIESGAVSNAMVSLIDLFPTFMAIAGMQPQPELELDGCDILPVLHGANAAPRFADGSVRDALYFHYPIEIPMSSSMRKGDWKLYLNTGPGVNRAPDVELFDLSTDLSERNNLAASKPEKRDELLADLHAWLKQHDAAMPYKNPGISQNKHAKQGKVPAITGRGSEGDQIWVTYAQGSDKAKVSSAILLYTINPEQFQKIHATNEEWFEAPARVEAGRVVADAPAGMTHGVLYIRDENDFLITSEALPTVRESGYRIRDSKIVAHGFGPKPGLASMIQCGEAAVRSARQAEQQTAPLERAVQAAQQLYAQQAIPLEACYRAMARVRNEIRRFDGIVPQADLEVMNLFPLVELGQ
jgi:arylsulfatase A-like enzyme